MKVEITIEHIKHKALISDLIEIPFNSFTGNEIYLSREWIERNFDELHDFIIDDTYYDGLMLSRCEIINELFDDEEQCRISVRCSINDWSIQ